MTVFVSCIGKEVAVLNRKLRTGRGHQGGFTLIEMVVVIAILGILAGIAIPRFMDSQASAKGAKIVADLRTIDSAATIYYAQKGKYPTEITGNNPPTTDGFVGQYLANWPVPDTGTFIVSLLKGGTKTYTGITADAYTLNGEGRGLYNGHPVEWYLKGSDSDSLTLFASTREAAYAANKKKPGDYLDGKAVNAKMTELAGGSDNLKVEDSVLTTAFGDSMANKNLRWFTNAGTADNAYYFANDYSSDDHGSWQGYLLVYKGKLYKSTNIKNNTVDRVSANPQSKAWALVGDFSF